MSIRIGDRFGRWTVEAVTRFNNRLACEVRCDCDTVKTVVQYSLRNGDSRSCGCFQIERRSESHTTHGLSGAPEYRLWCHMIGRCYCKTDAAYPDYGGRGIKMCDSWRTSFDAFIRDMGLRPSAKHSIERVDNDGNYEPGNCVWATVAEQTRNRRSNRHVMLFGERMVATDAEKRLGLSNSSLYNAVNRKGLPDYQSAVDWYVSRLGRSGVA